MKLKKPLLRSAVIITIIVLSVAIGFIYNSIGKTVDRKMYPREFSEFVEKYSKEYSVPEYIIYAVIKTESNFDKGYEGEDGGIGLMGIIPDEFDDMLKVTKENLSHDSLYGPETNIKYGTYQLARLYNMFEKWSTVCCAKFVGVNASASWLDDESNFNEDGVFETVPDLDAFEFGEKLFKCAEKYRKMYYGG